MKIVQINAVCGNGSTGKICQGISELLTEKNIENYVLYCSGESGYDLSIKCADDNYIKLQALKARTFGNWGFNSNQSTYKIISELEKLKPDVVHIHNIHGHDCNIEILFNYFKSKRIKLFWTFHDCWAFTGYCVYFDLVRCDKWKNGCYKCPQKKKYSWIFDRSSYLYKKKKELFKDLDLTIITPSKWLAGIVKRSFLSDYPVEVINNGIDLSVFKLTESDFREKNNLIDKKIVLGVAFNWEKRKGLDVFIELSKCLDDSHKIVLVGTDDEVDKVLPKNILSIHRTNGQKELAEIYTAADVFVNPTREDNYPTVNLEALACGTAVITFNTGGSPEMINESNGYVVEYDNISQLINSIYSVCEEHTISEDSCLRYAREFDKNVKFEEYIELYLSCCD